MGDDLFDLSRIQAGSFSREIDAIALDDLVSDCLAALEPLAAAQGVRLTGRVAGTATVAGNGPELNRALTNLVANAIRHTRADGRVNVLVGVTAGDNTQRAEVVIDDECGGIAEADLPRVFDVGFRGEPARTPQTDYPAGAGLGLAITRGIVEAHSGSVQVANTAEGCRFTVRLPIATT
jgi:signal transduction histidine kinase